MKRLIFNFFILNLSFLVFIANSVSPAFAKEALARDIFSLRLPIQHRAFEIGVAGFVPRNYPNPRPEDWLDLFQRLPETGELFGVYSEWNDTLVENIPQQIHTAYAIQGIIPVVALGFEPDQMTQEEADHYFEINGEAFKSVAIAVAERYQPKYLALGVETNRYYEKSPQGYQDFVAVYQQAYEEIKAISPNTKVFTIFQLEYMRGAGFLSGRPHTPHWNLINDFEGSSDLVGFTTYPFLDYINPEQIPANYYTDILQHTDKPIFFTETGWPSLPVAVIPGSQQAQVTYLIRLLETTRNLNLKALIWSFPHDLTDDEASTGLFDHISLRKNNGARKQVFSYWRALKSLPRE